MSRFNHFPSAAYREFVSTVKEFADRDDEDVVTATADALEDELRARFMDAHGVDATAETTCIAPLVAGWDDCQHVLPRKGDDGETPPHHPPHADHCDLWLDDGTPAAFTMHLYDVGRETLADLLDFADRWGLDFRISPASWYYANRTGLVVLYPPERFEKA